MKENITIKGELVYTFDNFNDWVNNASSRLGIYSKYTHVLVCIDSEGYTCFIGEDFMAARDGNRFPVKTYLLNRSINYNPNSIEMHGNWKREIIISRLHKMGFHDVAQDMASLRPKSVMACYETPDKDCFYFLNNGTPEGLFITGFDSNGNEIECGDFGKDFKKFINETIKT